MNSHIPYVLKKVLLGTGILSICIAAFFMLFPYTLVKSTIDLYIILNYKPFTTYVDCKDVLTKAASKETTYADVSPYMNEEIYNNLSVKTKSFYHSNQTWDDVIQVIHQQQDRDDHRLVYVDIIEYSTEKEPIKWIRVRQLAILAEGDSWQIIKYIEPMKPRWYTPTYIGRVYSLILPQIEK